MPARPPRLPQQTLAGAGLRRLPGTEPTMSKPANYAAPEDVEQAFYEAVLKGDADLPDATLGRGRGDPVRPSDRRPAAGYRADPRKLARHLRQRQAARPGRVTRALAGLGAGHPSPAPKFSSSATTRGRTAPFMSPTSMHAAPTAGAWSAVTPRPPTTAIRRWPTPCRTHCIDRRRQAVPRARLAARRSRANHLAAADQAAAAQTAARTLGNAG